MCFLSVCVIVVLVALPAVAALHRGGAAMHRLLEREDEVRDGEAAELHGRAHAPAVRREHLKGQKGTHADGAAFRMEFNRDSVFD